MKDLATVLMLVEDKAAAFYQTMAVYFQNDPSIAATLANFARDEESHSAIMKTVATCMIEGSETSFPLQFNETTELEISNTMALCIAMAKAGNLTLRQLGEAMLDIEFSEWNSLFFFVVNTFKDASSECKMAAIQLQGHLRRIQQFLEQIPLDNDLLARIRNLPSLWIENILVIDDEGTVRELLKAVLKRMGKVEVACDGVEGLEKIRGTYYALIVSDITMPRCNGIELFRQALGQFPSIGKRFLFFSGRVSDDQLSFIRQHNLELIEKPALLKEILTKTSSLLTAPVTH